MVVKNNKISVNFLVHTYISVIHISHYSFQLFHFVSFHPARELSFCKRSPKIFV